MTSQKELLTSIKPHEGIVTLANGLEIPVKGSGLLNLSLRTSTGKNNNVTIRDVLYIPSLKGGNLLSESKFEFDGCHISSKGRYRKVFKNGKEWILAILNTSKQFVVQQQKYKTSFASY